ncbi:MAG: DUF2723 domain-containing protein, partial [Odoribacter sp.]|nr:DUF2723 domain-containing protein [Odoribacter sp.]
GYSSYAMIVIRSISNPPIDENSPDNVFDLLSYINRDQYGDSPLIYGQYYNAGLIDVKEGSPIYYQNRLTGKYDQVGSTQKPIYDPRFSTIFPRMYSRRSQMHVYEYENWGGKPNGRIYDVGGQAVQKPSFGNNLRYFFRYQLGHMYWRYFMWNFSGRQNDIQGDGDIRYGNWITGIKFLDQIRLGNQSKLPDVLKDQKAHNKYFLLPFILGILGIIFQLSQGREGKNDFWVVLLLFFLTGIAIIIFLNQTPREPRERDYAYAGSFYAFSIWIGLGVLFIWERLCRVVNPKIAAIVATVVCLIVPGIMAAQNWDDHDRSGRYATIAHAKNYLNSCEPNAIIFTFGDNDTFPLWYAQEVEGVRRDIRVVNLSLLSGDWYIDQINRKAYESDKVAISVTKDQYHKGKRDYVYIIEMFPSANIKSALNVVFSDEPSTKRQIFQGGELSDFFPTKTLYFPVDSAKVIANGTVAPEDADKIVDKLEVKLTGDGLTKSQLMVLDIIATNNWERPIYFGVGMGTDNYLGFEKYFQLEGAAYRIIPIEAEVDPLEGYGRINTNILYDNIMNKFEWGNINDPKVNMDYFHDYTISVMQYRNTMYHLAKALYEKGDNEKAIYVLDKSLYELPTWQIPIDNILVFYIPLYYELGETQKATELLLEIFKENYQMSQYIGSLSPQFLSQSLLRDDRRVRNIMEWLADIAVNAGQQNILREFLVNVEGMELQEMMHPGQIELQQEFIQQEFEEQVGEELQQDTQLIDEELIN